MDVADIQILRCLHDADVSVCTGYERSVAHICLSIDLSVDLPTSLLSTMMLAGSSR